VLLLGGDVLGEVGRSLEPHALVPLGDEKTALQFSPAALLLLHDKAWRHARASAC
jgi:hypothetical protein